MLSKFNFKLLIVTTVILLLVATIATVAQRESTPVTRVQLCVKDNGQLRVTNNGSSCGPSEQLTEWVVGGQVTEIRAGQGLVSSRDDGIVSLALDPSILQNCAGCGRIIAGFNDGPHELPKFDFEEGLPQIAKLDLPAGNFAIFAKLVVTAKDIDFSFTRKEFALCQLSAENDLDRSNALLEVKDDRPIETIDNDEVVLSLEVVHRFAEPGAAVLRCSKGGFAGSDTRMEFSNLKIIAVEAASISNVFLGGN